MRRKCDERTFLGNLVSKLFRELKLFYCIHMEITRTFNLRRRCKVGSDVRLVLVNGKR